MQDHGFNHYVATRLPMDFYYQDIDGSMFKRDTKILRMLETKWDRETITNGQKTQLPIYAAMFEWAVDQGRIGEQSGVFIVRAIDGTWDRIAVSRVMPNRNNEFKTSIPVILEGNVGRSFQAAREIDSRIWTRLWLVGDS